MGEKNGNNGGGNIKGRRIMTIRGEN